MADQLTKPVIEAIKKEVNKTLVKYAKLFGFVSIGGVVALLALVWSLTTDLANTIANDIQNNVLEELKNSTGSIDETVANVNQLIVQMRVASSRLKQAEPQITELEASIARLQDDSLVGNIMDIIQLLEDSGNVAQLLASLDNKISSSVCQSPKIFSGQTDMGSTRWLADKDSNNNDIDNTATVEVDTSAANFEATPYYFISLGGTAGHWNVTGNSSVYHPSKDNFGVFLRFGDWETENGPMSEYAKAKKWYVNWLAIGC